MPVIIHNVISTHVLVGPKERRYVFRILPGEVCVERWEGQSLKSRSSRTNADARHLYKFLITTHGYRKWQP